MSAPQDHADLTIHTQRPAKSLKAKGDEDDGSQEMPLSPASVKDYNRKKAEKTKDSEEEEDDDDDDDDDDEFDAAHLDPRLEALDGTTKLKKGDNKDDDEDEDDDDEGDESPSSIEEDGSKDTDGGVVSKVEKALQDLKLNTKQSQTKDRDTPSITTNDAPTADPEASPALTSAITPLDTKDTTTVPTATTTSDATPANVTPATPTLTTTTTTTTTATTAESETITPGTILPTIVVPEEERVTLADETQQKEPSGKVSLESIQDSTSESSGDHTGTGASLSQPPSGTATPSDSMISIDQRERLQEPVRPRIALPCLVETANNPARTRITLKYSGHNQLHKPASTATTTTAASQPYLTTEPTKVSTRGRKNYMVATDLSGESWHATEWTITTILRNGDEMNVVTIVEDDKGEITKGVKKGVQVEMREDAEKLTKNIHEQLEHTNLRDITVVIHIIAATKSMGAKELLIEMIDDLDELATVIVGSRGRGAIKGLLLGSISNFLVHNSSVPVMVVRAPKKSKGRKNARRSRVYDHTRNVKEANLKYEQAFAEDE